MLTCVDRVQLAVTDRAHAAEPFRRLLGAEIAGEDAIAPLAVRRTTLAVGTSAVELLEPDGAGAVDTHLRRCGAGLFAAGFTTDRAAELRARLVARGLSFAEAGPQLFLAPEATGDHGLRCVVSPLAQRPAVGLASHLYEVTNLVADSAAASARYAEVFGLAPERYCPIESSEFGYRGVLTMFDPATRLDRIECITPYDAGKTMGRFMARRGESLYMCFVEAPDLRPIIARLDAHAPHDWSPAAGGATDTLFVHPKALAGLLLGVSRTSVGWLWSGAPECVVR